LMGEVQNIARRQPVAFFGAAVLTGFAFSRFLKSSGDGSSAGTGNSTARSPSSMAPGQTSAKQPAGDLAPSAAPASATTLTVSGPGTPEAETSRPGTSVEQP
jgi:hypothetical protein